MVSRYLLGRTDEEGSRYEGLCPLLESALGQNSQEPENAETRFSAFTDGRSQIGTQFGEAFNLLRQKAPGEAPGPLSRPVDALRPTNEKKKNSKTNLPSKSRSTEYETSRDASTNSIQATGEKLLSKTAQQALQLASPRSRRMQRRFHDSHSPSQA